MDIRVYLDRRSLWSPHLPVILGSLFLYPVTCLPSEELGLPIDVLSWLLNDARHLTKVRLPEPTGFPQDLFALP